MKWRTTVGTQKSDSLSWFGLREKGRYLLVAQVNRGEMMDDRYSWAAVMDTDGNLLKTVNTGRRLVGVGDADTTDDGGLIVAGDSRVRILWKLNAFYEPEWVMAVISLRNCFYRGYEVYAAKDGDYVLNTAHAFHGIYVKKYPATTLPEELRWSNLCAMLQTHPENDFNEAISLFETRKGNFLTTYGREGKSWLKKIKLSGGAMWERKFGHKYRIIAENKYGEIFLFTDDTSPAKLVKVSPDGKKKLVQRETGYIKMGVSDGRGGIVTVGRIGRYHTGQVFSEGSPRFLIRAFNRQGEPKWGHVLQNGREGKNHNEVSLNSLCEILKTAEGDYLLAGTMDTKRRGRKACVMKIEAPE